MDLTQRDHNSRKAVNVGLVSNIFLSILKTSAGILGHSQALLADGINSTSDVAYYVVVKVFMHLSGRPADSEHPYGHRQFESIAAMVVGAFIVTTAIAVFWNSVNNAYDLLSGNNDLTGASVITFWIALFTIAIKIWLTIFTKRVGKKINNIAVSALALDHRNDIFSASAVAIGIFVARAGYSWFDPMAGAIVAFLILKTGIEIMRGSSIDLMDTVPGDSLTKDITGLLEAISEIKKIEEIYAHRFGPYYVVNITICIDGSMTVEAGDKIATETENTIYTNIDAIQRVHVHYHPAGSQKCVDQN